MTNQQPDAQFDWATELLDAEGHVTLSAKEAKEIGARLRSMGEKLKAYEDLDEAASDVQLLRMGYAEARLEIESLQSRIKTMAEEHADELMVAHLDGRMRAAQPAGAQQPGNHGEKQMPLLARDIAADFGVTPVQVCSALVELGFGHLSVNMAITPEMAEKLREYFANAAQQAPAQAAPAAVAVPTFEDFCKRHGLDPKKMDGHGGMWARVALDECRATAQPSPTHQADSQPAPVRDYPPLPNFDSGDEPIWNAIFNWKTATPGPDAHRKANAIESAIIDQLRAYVDADRAMRAAQPVGAQQPDTAYAELPSYEHQRAIMEAERNASLDEYSRIVLLTSTESRIYERAFTNGWNRRASHGQAPAGLAVPSMSADEVNALPTAARAYIHQLATNTDPAGMVRENMQLRDTNAGLQSMYRKAADAAQEVVGCFHAAECEGLQAALAGTADEHIKDLVERRLMHALYAAQEVAGQAPAQEAPAAVAGPSAPGMQDAIRQYTEAQDALDNREYAGINAEPYDKLLRARNAARRDLEAALAAAPATQPAPQQEARPVTPYTCPKCHALWLHWPAEQSGFGVDTLNCRSATHCDYCEKGGVEQLERLERVPAALKAPQQEAQEPVGYTHASWIAEAKRGGGGSFVGRKNAAFDVPIYTAPQPSPTPQADSQPAPANTRQIAECYGDCPTDPKTCANPCKFEGRAARAPADSQPAPDEILNMAREQGLPETETEGVFRVNVDDLGRVFASYHAARAPADIVTAPAGERENLDLRRMLCVAHAGAAAYMDDGEAQDSRDLPVIDFLRDTPAEIQDKLHRRALKKLATPTPPTQAADIVTAPAGGEVAYLDIGAGGYLDLGTDLSNEALSRLPKGRHALVIAGTYGIDGYTPTPPTQAADSVLEDAALTFTGAHIDYVARYGGRCCDCADESGVCPGSGLPCADSRKAIKHVFDALEYGVKHGYIKSPVAASNQGGEA